MSNESASTRPLPAHATAPGGRRRQGWLAAAPALFVAIWSTGFIGARLGVPHADPLTLLAIRFTIAFVLMGALAWLTHAPLPNDRRLLAHSAITGVLLHGVYLAGVFISISRGMAAAVTALIVGLQPVVAASIARRMVGERVDARQWGGLTLGVVGVALVLLGDHLFAHDSPVALGGATAMSAALLALGALSVGTLYQKRYATGVDLRVGAVCQFGAAMVVMWAAAYVLEPMRVHWTVELFVALAWLVLMLSFGAVTLLMLLIRHGAASEVSSLFFLVPPATALEAWLLFDQRLGYVAVMGMLVAALGVSLVVRKKK